MGGKVNGVPSLCIGGVDNTELETPSYTTSNLHVFLRIQ